MSQSPDCSGWDKLIVLWKQVSRWSVLKKMLGLCCKGWQWGAESESRVRRVARREHLCVACTGQKKDSRSPFAYCYGSGEEKKQGWGGEWMLWRGSHPIPRSWSLPAHQPCPQYRSYSLLILGPNAPTCVRASLGLLLHWQHWLAMEKREFRHKEADTKTATPK